jgi:hypothetical protein
VDARAEGGIIRRALTRLAERVGAERAQQRDAVEREMETDLFDVDNLAALAIHSGDQHGRLIGEVEKCRLKIERTLPQLPHSTLPYQPSLTTSTRALLG